MTDDALKSDNPASVTPPVAPAKWRWAARAGCLAAALPVLWVCWARSASRLGDLYDYSFFIASAQHILSGLRPYHDIQTPMQSLIYLYSAGWEALLGQSYAAMAWGNFALALVLFAAVLVLLDGPLRLAGAFLIALCLPLATVLQHGVPSPNSLSFTILAVQSLLAARAASDGRLGPGRVGVLLVLATLGGMGKLNFHFVGIGATALGVFLSLQHGGRAQRSTLRALLLAGGYVLFSLVAGPLLEMAWTGVSAQTWWYNVIETPVERRGWLINLRSSEFWFGILNNNYPKVFIGGIAFVAALLFALGGIVCFVVSPGGWGLNAIVRRCFPAVVGGYYLLGGSLLVLLNSETLILNAAYFVVGLTCMSLVYGGRIGAWARFYFNGAALSLALVMLIAGVVALWNFSRINYGREDIAARWVPAGEVDPSAGQFFGPLQFSPRTAALLSELFAVVDRYELRANHRSVYWGPGLELMNQLNGPSQVPGLPLAYARNLSVRDSDSPRIIERLRAAPYQWIIMNQMWSIHFPAPVLAYVQEAYELEQSDQYLIVYRRRAESALP